MSGPLDAYDMPEPANLPMAQKPAELGELWQAQRELDAADLSVGPFRRDRDAWAPVVDALGLNPYDNPAYFGQGRLGKATSLKPRTALGLLAGNATRDEQEALILERVRARRATDPNFLRDVPDSPAAFRQWTIAREQEKRARARATLARSPGGLLAGATELGASALEGLTDPLNIMTLPVGGGGKTLGGILLRESLVNAGLEAAQTPLVALNRAELGEELTLGEAATNVAVAGVAGGLLEAGGTAAVRGVAGEIDKRTPLDVKLARALGDAELPALARDAIGWDNLTPDQRAAVNVIEREGEIDGGSPYAKGGPSLETHGERLAAAMERIADETPPAPVPAVAPSRVETVDRTGGVQSGPRAGLTGSGFERYMRRVGGVESGNSATARNPRSSAEGVYQFTDGTWLAYYKRRFGASGLSDAAILSKKRDRGVQDQLMRDLTADNARALGRAGEAETAGNLYLAHFAGPKGALRVLKADPDAPIERVMDAAAIEANPFLRGKTAGEVVEWAHRKMGEPSFAGQRVTLDRAGFAATDSGEVEWRAAQAALDAEIMGRIAAERAALPDTDRDGLAAGVEPEWIAAELRPWQSADDAPSTDAGAALMPPPDPELVGILPAVRKAVMTPGQSLDPAKLARRLQTTEDLARRALQSMAARGRAVLVDKNGRFRRPMVRREEPDVVTWVADRGGVRDDQTMGGQYGAHDLKRRLEVFVPGAGKLHRPKNGMSLDELGEALWEDGWFRERPTVADVLDLLERGVSAYGGPKAKRVYRPDRQIEAVAAAERAQADEELIARIHERSRDIDLDADQAERVAVDVDRYLNQGESIDDAIARAIDDEIGYQLELVQRGALFDDEDALYKAIEELEAEGYVGSPKDRIGAEDRGEPGFLEGDAGPRGADGETGGGSAREDADDAQGLGPLEDPGAYRAFDDPAGDGATRQIESLEHDVRMDAGLQVDPAIAERQRQEAALRAAGPLRGENRTGVEQDGTMGLGLFDAADQPTFRLTEDGDEISRADMLRALDEDDAGNAALRGCMTPPKGGEA